ncbi:hypothetical protein V9L05_21495 (plasmid) [Bernardetia sp. Wsw4-3y2]|uniref:hypothetical protein n=1 Tax=Bernardetia sp. Wsw4-3y2 TaxID=3127471 RepID=UPI0030CE3A02
MKTKNIFWLLAGILNLFTALLHTFGGQVGLINPLLSSNLDNQVQTEFLGVWHMITLFLFFTSAVFIKNYFAPKEECRAIIQFISYVYFLFSISFIAVSFMNQLLAPQWTLLLPIGILGLIGVKKYKLAH